MTIVMTFGEYLDTAARAAETTIGLFGYPKTFAGFALLFCISFGASLLYFRPRDIGVHVSENRLSRALLGLGLLSQLLLLMLLLTHRSDSPQVFGRFSPAYAVVIATNIMFIFFFVLVLWQRRRISAALNRSMQIAWLCVCVTITAALVLFLFTQLRSAHWRATTYLYLSTLLLLLFLAAQLSDWLRDERLRSLLLLAVLSTLVAWALLGFTIFIALAARGFMKDRLLTQAAFFMVFSGLLWARASAV